MGIEGGNYQEPVEKRPKSRMRRIMRAEMQAIKKRIIKEHKEKLEAQRKEQREKQDNLDSKSFQQTLRESEEEYDRERKQLKDFIKNNKVDTSENLTIPEEKTHQKELTDKEKRMRGYNSEIIGIADYIKGEIKDLANINDYGIQFKKSDGSEITLTFNKGENQNNIPYDKYVTTFYLKNTKDNTTSIITIDRKGQLYYNGEPKYNSEAEEILRNFGDNTSQFEKYWTKKMLAKQQEEDSDNADKWADEKLNEI